jgi:hypothetical protein
MIGLAASSTRWPILKAVDFKIRQNDGQTKRLEASRLVWLRFIFYKE